MVAGVQEPFELLKDPTGTIAPSVVRHWRLRAEQTCCGAFHGVQVLAPPLQCSCVLAVSFYTANTYLPCSNSQHANRSLTITQAELHRPRAPGVCRIKRPCSLPLPQAKVNA